MCAIRSANGWGSCTNSDSFPSRSGERAAADRLPPRARDPEQQAAAARVVVRARTEVTDVGDESDALLRKLAPGQRRSHDLEVPGAEVRVDRGPHPDRTARQAAPQREPLPERQDAGEGLRLLAIVGRDD